MVIFPQFALLDVAFHLVLMGFALVVIWREKRHAGRTGATWFLVVPRLPSPRRMAIFLFLTGLIFWATHRDAVLIPRGIHWLAILFTAIVVPVGEEFWLRAMLVGKGTDWVRRHARGTGRSILVAALVVLSIGVFAMLQARPLMPYMVLLGTLCVAAYILGKSNVAYPIFVHAVWNLLSLFWGLR